MEEGGRRELRHDEAHWHFTSHVHCDRALPCAIIRERLVSHEQTGLCCREDLVTTRDVLAMVWLG